MGNIHIEFNQKLKVPDLVRYHKHRGLKITDFDVDKIAEIWFITENEDLEPKISYTLTLTEWT